MSWALWLLAPVLVTVLVAVGSWWVGRPKRAPNTDEAMRAHDAYLHALGATARAKDRGPLAPRSD